MKIVDDQAGISTVKRVTIEMRITVINWGDFGRIRLGNRIEQRSDRDPDFSGSGFVAFLSVQRSRVFPERDHSVPFPIFPLRDWDFQTTLCPSYFRARIYNISLPAGIFDLLVCSWWRQLARSCPTILCKPTANSEGWETESSLETRCGPRPRAPLNVIAFTVCRISTISTDKAVSLATVASPFTHHPKRNPLTRIAEVPSKALSKAFF